MNFKDRYYIQDGKVTIQSYFYFFLMVSFIWIFVAYLNGTFNDGLSGDEGDYIDRGRLIISQGMAGLTDGYRPPFFPMWIGLVSVFVPQDRLLYVIRVLNIIIVAVIPLLWLWAGSKRRDNFKGIFICMAFLTAIWPPFFLFSFRVYAEAWSFFILNILIIILIGFNKGEGVISDYIRSIMVSVCLSVLFYLKTNNIMVALPVVVTAFVMMNNGLLERVKNICLIVLFTVLFILPWLFFIGNSTGQLKISTTGGINLLVGTGYYDFGMNSESEDSSSLPNKYLTTNIASHRSLSTSNNFINKNIFNLLSEADYNKLSNAITLSLNTSFGSIARAHETANVDTVAKDIAQQIWRENTHEQTVYGILKVIHSYGGSLRGAKDYVTLLFLGIVTIASFFIIRKPEFLPLVLLHWGCVFCGCVLAFFFLPNIRFKTFYFDVTGLILLSIMINQLLLYKKENNA